MLIMIEIMVVIDPPPTLERLEAVPLDPWNREYEMRTDGGVCESLVASAGPDGVLNTEAD